VGERDEVDSRFGALAFVSGPGFGELHEMRPREWTRGGKLTDLIPSEAEKRWESWLGEIAWKSLRETDRMVLIKSEAETTRLQTALDEAWTALLLCGPDAAYPCRAWKLWGRTSGLGADAPLVEVDKLQEPDQPIEPYYMHDPTFVDLLHKRTYPYFVTHGRPDDRWFLRWTSRCELLARPSRPLHINYALRAFSRAWSTPLLDFSIPDFVRAAEGVLAVPRRKKVSNEEMFATRSLHLVPGLANDELVGGRATDLLVELYRLRNDCVHSKAPFHDMAERGEKGRARLARLTYLAEVVAREAILAALRLSDWSMFESREGLEAAWEEGLFSGRRE
jgi:hypothetical protein